MLNSQTNKWNSPKPITCDDCGGKSIEYQIDLDGHLFLSKCRKYQYRDDSNIVIHSIKLGADDDKSILAVNGKKIVFEKITLESLKGILFKLYLSPVVREGTIQFFMEYMKSKIEASKIGILENPDDKQICRPIGDQEVTNINVFNRNAIFLIINNHERKRLTEISPDGKVLDVLKHRHIKSWSGDHEIHMQGPVLCDNDKLIFDTCLKLHHENGFKGIMLNTSFSEIWRALGNSGRPGANNIASLKRSLSRLSSVNVQFTSKIDKKKFFWSGGIIDTYSYVEAENNKYSKVVIKFNSYMINIYLNGAYSTLSMQVLLTLKSYPRRIFEFLITHKDPKKKMSLKKWREIIGIEDDVPDFTFRRRMRDAIADLKQAGHLAEQSGFMTNTIGEDLIFTDFLPAYPSF